MREAAIILAGGRGRRLGALPPGGKAAVEIGGRSLLERVVAAAATEVERIVVVTAAARPIPPLHEVAAPLEVIHDTHPGSGPLAAIVDGMRRLAVPSTGPPVGRCLIAACDLPLLEPAVVRLLLDACGEDEAAGIPSWVVPVVGGYSQVLVSAMAMGVLPTLERYLDEGRRDLRGLLGRLTVRLLDEARLAEVDPTLASFRDLDTPGDRESIAALSQRRGLAYTPGRDQKAAGGRDGTRATTNEE